MSSEPSPAVESTSITLLFDSEARRVFLSHGSEVLVVNADTGALEGKISGLQLSHGVALVHDVDRGFITDGEQGKIVVFDLKTLKVIGDVSSRNCGDGNLPSLIMCAATLNPRELRLE